jgi:SAM-dependent methyltransferase
LASHPPLLSAILCTFNRGALLSRGLESIASQTLAREDFEVIVIDDGSTDDTRRVVESFERRFHLRYAYQSNAGLASAKNHGIYCSGAPIILFLDDDEVFSPSLFEEHIKTHRAHPENHYAALGYTGLHPSIADKPLMHFVTEVGCYLFSYPHLKHGNLLDYTYFWGGRTSCKRTFLIQHGVFNPVFRFGCEDIELGYRLSKHNLQVKYNARAISTMIRDISFDAFCARLVRQGQSQHVFSRLHQDAEVQRWCKVLGAEDKWQKTAPVFDKMLHSARELNRIADLKLELGLGLDDLTKTLLHGAYHNAFRACNLKGIWEKKTSQQTQPAGAQLFADDGLAVPPVRLRTLVAGEGNGDLANYFAAGERCAVMIRRMLRTRGLDIDTFGEILDFGCGCGRVIRQFRALKKAKLHGTDINREQIEWCQRNIPFARFEINQPYPPLSFEDETFDFIYAFSVFTHLPESAQFLWMTELSRVVKAGGYLLITTHGENYALLLDQRAQARFQDNEMVVFNEEDFHNPLTYGKCSAYHPEKYVREKLAKTLDVVDFVKGEVMDAGHRLIRQDAYLLRKPLAGIGKVESRSN